MKLVASLSSLIALGFSSCQMEPSSAGQLKTPAHLPATTKEYKDELERQLGPPWYRLAEINADSLSVGTVTVKFEIPAAGGRARNLRVISNTGGRMDERIAREAVAKLRAPPVSPALLGRLRQNYFEMEESFTVFRDPAASPTASRKH
jgi:outer membrane biosynthesis protein TonB